VPDVAPARCHWPAGRLTRSAVAGIRAVDIPPLDEASDGRSNSGIAQHLAISERTVEAACAQLFRKLDLEPSPDVNRRVLAVLALLRS
jgi:DNA-binding CsgD family transcriptional regulator